MRRGRAAPCAVQWRYAPALLTGLPRASRDPSDFAICQQCRSHGHSRMVNKFSPCHAADKGTACELRGVRLCRRPLSAAPCMNRQQRPSLQSRREPFAWTCDVNFERCVNLCAFTRVTEGRGRPECSRASSHHLPSAYLSQVHRSAYCSARNSSCTHPTA